MKAQFYKALIRSLLDEHNFLLLKDRGGTPVLSPEHSILIKKHLGSTIFVELIDGDKLSGEAITARLQHNTSFLATNKPQNGIFFFEIFIFEAGPDQDQLAAVKTGQFQNPIDKTFLKCLTVNLATQSVERHFNLPETDVGLTKTITRLFTAGTSETTSYSELVELAYQKEQEYQVTLRSKEPLITYVFIGLNVIIWALLSLYSMKSGLSYNHLLISFGAKDNFQILSGEYWRFLTPIFLHANLFHLFINCYSLYAVGNLVERIFGRFRFVIVYLIAGIMGNILSFIFSTNPGVGASGSLFGLLGSLLFFGILKPGLFKSHFGHNIILTIVLNLGYGFTNAGIDNFAHIGGLIGGFLASGIVLSSNKKRWYTNPLFYFCFTIITVCAGLMYGFNNTQNQVMLKINQLDKLDQAQNWTQAELKAKEILRLKPGNKGIRVYTLWTLAKAQALSGKYSEALVTAKELTAIDPANGHYLQGLFYYDLRQYARAREELERAKRAGVKYEAIDGLLEEIEKLGK